MKHSLLLVFKRFFSDDRLLISVIDGREARFSLLNHDDSHYVLIEFALHTFLVVDFYVRLAAFGLKVMLCVSCCAI